jgi:hypothetical protein
MAKFKVSWLIDVDLQGDDPAQFVMAALEAWRQMRKPDSTACVFLVRRDGDQTGVAIDLEDYLPRETIEAEGRGGLSR